MPLTKLQFRPGITEKSLRTLTKGVGETVTKLGFGLVILKKLVVGKSLLKRPMMALFVPYIIG